MMKKLSKKWIVTLVCVVLLACVSVGSTLAYIFTKTMPLDNSFNPVYLTCETVGNVKTGVKVKNTGTTDGYIRATVVVNWVKELDNSVHATAVTEGVDYTVDGEKYTFTIMLEEDCMNFGIGYQCHAGQNANFTLGYDNVEVVIGTNVDGGADDGYDWIDSIINKEKN